MLMVFEKRPHFFGGLLPRALTAVALVSVLPLISSAQPSPGVFGPGPGCNLFPAPPSVGATVGPELGRPCPIAQIRPGGYRQRNRHVASLSGTLATGNRPVWYILPDVSDPEVASLLGLNFSAKLNFAANGVADGDFRQQ